MAGDDVTITIRANSGDAIRAFRDVNGQLRDMRGRFVSEGSIMSRSMNQLTASIRGARGALIPLATAAVPLAAALGPVAVKSAAAGAAVAAFGVALAGQVSHLSDASKAQEKYTDAVVQYGRGSKQAAEAQRQVAATLAGMPKATQRAAVGFQTLKGTFREWSDSTAKFTMAPVEKSFTVLGQILPKLTPIVKGTSTQLDRLVSVAGGAIATPGFDALADKFSTFANDALKDAVDGIIHFSRALSEGQASGPIKAFMDYAAQNGPAVRETLSTLGDAVSTLATAAADAGPGMLTLVNAAAGLVASFPPELITVLMQTAVALKAVSLASAGTVAVGGLIASARGQIAALGAASTAAGGGLAGLRAAFLSLGTAAKASVVAAGVIAVGLALTKLSDIGQQAPPKMDQLTASIRELGQTGKVTGEAARVFGEDMSELAASFDKVTDNDALEFFDELSSGFGLFGEGTNEAAKKMIDSFDESLANLVKSGNADLAKAALENFRKEAAKSGYDIGDVNKRLDGYKTALADAKFEQELAVQSMGIFGQAALETSTKLEAQKQSADGLRASILALNEVNRSAYDAQIGFEESLDSLTESFKKHGDTLNLDSEAGRANAQAMSQAAKSQDELIATGLAAGESLGSMTKKSNELRETMMRLATDAFDGNKQKATDYVNTLLGTPGEIKTLVKLEREEAIAGLESVREAIRATPGSKEVRVDTLNGAAIAALEAVGLKTKQLPDGRTAVYTANGQALGGIGAVSTALNNLDGNTATTYVRTVYTKAYQDFRQGERDFTNKANGGVLEFYANGGTREQHVAQMAPAGTMRVWAEPETGGEAYIPLSPAKRPRSIAVLGEVADRFGFRLEEYARGGVRSLARGARDEIRDATSGNTERNLLRLMDAISRGHLKMASALKQVTGALDKAKDKLSDLKSAASQLSNSVKSGILSGASITKAAGAEDAQVTINTLMSQMQGSAANAKQFDQMLKTLRKRGLSKDLLAQIAEAGIEGGGLETAAAILGGGNSEIKQLNRLQSQINTAAGSAGKTTADAMYGKQIKAQEKLVKSLDRLADVLKAITKATEAQKAARKKVRKKAAGGIAGGLTWVGEEGPELVRLPQGSTVYPAGQSRQMAWASMLNQPRTIPAHGGGAAAGRPIVVHQTITLDGKVVARQIFDPLREEIAHRGGNVQQSLGRG